MSDELKWKLLELDVVDSATENQNDDDKTSIDKKSVRSRDDEIGWGHKVHKGARWSKHTMKLE